MVYVTFWLYFPWQPNPSNKLAIIHILGLLSNLFTTLDISHHDDDHESTEVKKLPVQQGPNPVSTAVARCSLPQPGQSLAIHCWSQEREVNGECSVYHEEGSAGAFQLKQVLQLIPLLLR